MTTQKTHHLTAKALALPFVIFSLSGCTDLAETVGVAGGNCVIEAVTAPVAETTDSRTAYDPTVYTSGQIGINWLPTDQIGVYSATQANVAFSNQSGTETASTRFVGSLDGTPVYAYYPYSAVAGSDHTALQGSIPSTQHYSTATRELEADWKAGTYQGNNKFRFEHMFALLRYEVNAQGTPVSGEKLESITLTIPGTQLWGDFTYNFVDGKTTFATKPTGAETLTMEWTDRPELSDRTFYGFMTCAPVSGIAGKEITVDIKTSKHTTSFKVTSKASAITANTYYTLPLDLRLYADKIQWEEREDVKREDAAWVPGLQSKLACANWVFSVPGNPFMHKIRTSDNTQTIEVYNLPQGLTWNSKRRLVEGTAPAAGSYTYSVEVTNQDGSVAFAEGIKLTVSDNLPQPTPHMGWQSWNVFEENINEDIIKGIADALVSKGLAAAGYTCVGIDDCWQLQDGGRDSNGVPVVDTSKFPDFKALTDYLHSKGLKAGIYSDCGTVTCASKSNVTGELLAAYGYEEAMAKQFVAWGFDKLKEDWFWKGHGDTGDKVSSTLDSESNDLAHELYGKMGNTLMEMNKEFILSMCEWGIHEPWKWGPEVGASSWRVSYDARDAWNGSGNTSTTTNRNGMGLRNSIDWMRNNNLGIYSGVNRFNDMDMLCVGIRGNGNSSSDAISGSAGMSDEEYETNFVMWCMHSSPLLITCDVRNAINDHDLKLLTNKELIAINQDPMGQGAELIKTVGSNKQGKNLDYYMKDLAYGDVAIAVVNLSESQVSYSIDFDEYDALDEAKTYKLVNCLTETEDGTLSKGGKKEGKLNKHACVVYRLTAQ